MAKPGRKGINYKDVVHACKTLEDQEEIVTVRKVLALTGGSFSNVSSYIKKWQEAKAALQKSTALPEELIEALKMAYLKMFDHERKLSQIDFTNERKMHAETLQEVVKLESEREKLTTEVERMTQHYQNIVSAHEKKLAAAESRVVDGDKREKDLSEKIEALREQLKQTEIKCAVAESRADEYKKQLSNSGDKTEKIKGNNKESREGFQNEGRQKKE